MAEIDELKRENQKLRKELDALKSELRSKTENQKKMMIDGASKGELMSRPPFGYIMDKKMLVPAQNFSEVEDIFNEFLDEQASLRQVAQKHKLSVNGLKKILKNFTYIGKKKFRNQIPPENHKPIISTTLFNHVQDKLERLGIK